MLMSVIPLVMPGQSDPVVGRLRQVLNLPGGNELDQGMVEVLRGVQRARGRQGTGWIDEELLGWYDITMY